VVVAAEVTVTDRAGHTQFLPLARQPVSRPGGPIFFGSSPVASNKNRDQFHVPATALS